ncbi:SEFIR domain-containing protein [Methylobacter tundripaludum]|uniref:SEFIR domain-containing protein n=1 Tax=Methylobacter tundripaludum TaxID=173365 RepID=UPI00068CFDB7|nr:SEFIR domain-containing protein [Methylobacter tundripaludum]
MCTKPVFISYSHDSPQHKEAVLSLSERLRDDGIETTLDQYTNGTPDQGWPRWMLDKLDEASFVLVVCTETYYQRFRGLEQPGLGKGVDWEGALITQELYDSKNRTTRFVPVLFESAPETAIPEPLRAQTFYRLTNEENYQALYDFLLNQSGVEPGALGQLKRKPRKQGTPLTFVNIATAQTVQISPSKLRHSAQKLFGRESELAVLDAAWADPTIHIQVIVAWGGTGKTSLVAEWMAGQDAAGWPDCARVFDWSFYSQGSREQSAASADGFIAAALVFFGDAGQTPPTASPWDKGARLVQLIAAKPSLLVLDGLEPLQQPTGPLRGRLKDPAMETLLKGLARQNPGLCLLTSREGLPDLDAWQDKTVAYLGELERDGDHYPHLCALPLTAGVDLLKSLGVKGRQEEFVQLVQEVKGHALTLKILGGYLKRAHGGDIHCRDQIKFNKADAAIQGGHAFKVMAAYVAWLAAGGEQGQRELAILRLMGLFDRPADAASLTALRNKPAIPGLTVGLVDLDEDDWNLCVSDLAEMNLISPSSDKPFLSNLHTPLSLDSHPLVREYFADELRQQYSEAWRSGHQRLYEHLTSSTEYRPDTLEALQSLYQAIVHGCLAGLQQEAYINVYRERIQRGTGDDGFYSTNKLGAFAADINGVICFFTIPWSQVSSMLSKFDQGWMLNQAAGNLRALGRLSEALLPMRKGLEQAVKLEDWRNSSNASRNLSELEVDLGMLREALTDAEQAVAYADRSGTKSLQIISRATLANALQQIGRRNEAKIYFRKTEKMLLKLTPNHPLLSSLWGFHYCELLLTDVERTAAQFSTGLYLTNTARQVARQSCGTVTHRATQTLTWAKGGNLDLIGLALNHLTIARTALYSLLLESGNTASPSTAILKKACTQGTAAVDGLRHTGRQQFILQGLLTRAWLRASFGETDSGPDHAAAQADLDDAWDIAERGPMPLHQADIHLYRARLFNIIKPYPWHSQQTDLYEARRLIELHGYGKRLAELQDLERLLGPAHPVP